MEPALQGLLIGPELGLQKFPKRQLPRPSRNAGGDVAQPGHQLCKGVRDAVPGPGGAAALCLPEQLGDVHPHDWCKKNSV